MNDELELSWKDVIVVYVRHLPVRIEENIERLAIMACHRAKVRFREPLNIN